MVIGLDLKRMRLKAGLSESQMARKLGVSRTTIQNYEAEVSEPTVSRYLKWMLICRINAVAYMMKVMNRKSDREMVDLQDVELKKNAKQAVNRRVYCSCLQSDIFVQQFKPNISVELFNCSLGQQKLYQYHITSFNYCCREAC